MVVFSGLADHYFNTSLFSPGSLLNYNHISSSPGTVFMSIINEEQFTAVCVEGFFYGKLSA